MLVISQNKEVLENFIEVYKDLRFRGTYNGDLIFLKNMNIDANKDEMLSSLKDNYNFTLARLIKLGADVSAFPSSLEDLTKKDGE